MRGRKPFGTEYVDRFEGSEEAKRRYKALLEVSHGTLRVCEACERLGISPQRFHDLREEFTAKALALLESGKAGRPRAPTEEAEKIRALEEENRQLRLEMDGLRVQAEVNLIMPRRKGVAAKKALLRQRRKKPTGPMSSRQPRRTP